MTCRYCGQGDHTPEACPQVIEIRYRKDGTIKRVSLGYRWLQHPPAQQWPWITYQGASHVYPTADIPHCDGGLKQ